MSQTQNRPIIQMKGIVKRFPGVLANDHIDLEIYPGEVHALLGENGAGKTTLMNILYGLYPADEGQIFVRGSKAVIDNPNAAISLGIGMVHQHFMLVPPFTVAENIILGSEPRRRRILLDRAETRRRVQEMVDKYGLKVDMDAKVQAISVGQQQRVEILKALYKGAEVLILDEPTAVLTPQEVVELKEVMDGLARQGKAIIFITHKLNEVMSMSHKVTVIRRGRVIGTVNTKETSPRELAKMMVGREVVLEIEKQPAKPKQVILSLRDIHAVDDRNLPALRGVNLDVRAGEIVGIAGVDGNGQTELVEVITGLRKATKGDILLRGNRVENPNPRRMFELGVAHVPEDRHRRGMVLDFSLAENAILGSHFKPPFCRGITMNYEAVREYARKLIKEYDVRTPNEEVMGSSLSGGNQQKLVVGRELDREPDLLVASQPTRGLDVGAIEFIHSRLVEQRDKGKAVLLVSLELDEVMSLADRIAVIYEGVIVAVVDPKATTEEEIGCLMAGVKVDHKEKGGDDHAVS